MRPISLITIGVDFGITQVVDGNWGVHAVIKKDIFCRWRDLDPQQRRGRSGRSPGRAARRNDAMYQTAVNAGAQPSLGQFRPFAAIRQPGEILARRNGICSPRLEDGASARADAAGQRHLHTLRPVAERALATIILAPEGSPERSRNVRSAHDSAS